MSTPSSSSVRTAEDALLGAVLRRRLENRGGHKRSSTCGGCGENLMRTGLPALAYTFESCTCGSHEYSHLIERLWHRDCLAQEALADQERLKKLEVGLVRT